MTKFKLQSERIILTLQNVVNKSAASLREKFFVVRNANVSAEERVMSAALRLRSARLPWDAPRILCTGSVPGIFWSSWRDICAIESIFPANSINCLTSWGASWTALLATDTSTAADTRREISPRGIRDSRATPDSVSCNSSLSLSAKHQKWSYDKIFKNTQKYSKYSKILQNTANQKKYSKIKTR